MEYSYRDLWHFQVLDELYEGNVVCVLDKQTCEVRELSIMMVAQLMQLLASAKKDEARYLFWKIVEIKETEDEEDD